MSLVRRIRVKKLAHSAVMEEMLFLQRISRHREEIDQKTFLNQVSEAVFRSLLPMRCDVIQFRAHDDFITHPCSLGMHQRTDKQRILSFVMVRWMQCPLPHLISSHQ